MIIEKIPGEFLRLEEEDSCFKLWYAKGEANPVWVRLHKDHMVLLAESAKREIERLRGKLSLGEVDASTKEKINSQIEFFRIEAVWPEMYIAFCKGENLGRFFEKAKPPEIMPFGIPMTEGKALSRGDHGVVTSLAKPKRFKHGELKKRLKSYLSRDECKENEKVESAKIAKWVREMTADGYYTSESIIRARLSDMGFTSEKEP
jgi:hypothetical protein